MREQREDDGIGLAIDRAVREAMNADAGSAFRAQVLARIQEPRTSLWRPWLPLGAAAGGAIVLALALWPDHQRATPSTPAAPPMHVSNAAPSASGQTPPTKIGATAPVKAALSRRRTAARRADVRPGIAAMVADRSRDGLPAVDVAPLTPVDAIDVAPIVREAIVSTAVSVAPLTPITAVETEPLSARSARD